MTTLEVSYIGSVQKGSSLIVQSNEKQLIKRIEEKIRTLCTLSKIPQPTLRITDARHAFQFSILSKEQAQKVKHLTHLLSGLVYQDLLLPSKTLSKEHCVWPNDLKEQLPPKEKDRLFALLALETRDPEFRNKYTRFCRIIQEENWYEILQNEPLCLSKQAAKLLPLSFFTSTLTAEEKTQNYPYLYAFLLFWNEDIDEEEFFLLLNISWSNGLIVREKQILRTHTPLLQVEVWDQEQCKQEFPALTQTLTENAFQALSPLKRSVIRLLPCHSSFISPDDAKDKRVYVGHLDVIFSPSILKLFPQVEAKLPSKHQFLNNPLFVNTKEKDDVYEDLCHLAQTQAFSANYTLLLNSLNAPDWFTAHLQNETQLALFSLVFFLAGAIDQEELFVIQTVLTTVLSKKKKFIAGAAITLLDEGNFEEYLRKAHFPPFSEVTDRSILNHRKSPQELELDISKIKQDLALRSPIKRTALAYHYDSRANAEERSSIEENIYTLVGIRLGFLSTTDQSLHCVLLPPFLALDLFRATSCYPMLPTKDYAWQFGYSEDNTPFYEGSRAISVASPLFSVPFVHDRKSGAKSLGLFFHDINYHVPMEASHPLTPWFASLAKLLKTPSTPSWEPYRSWLLNNCLDREFPECLFTPTSFSPLDFLVLFCQKRILDASHKNKELPMESLRQQWIEEELYPLFCKASEEHPEIGLNLPSAKKFLGLITTKKRKLAWLHVS